MNQFILSLLAFFGGMCLAVQGGLNAHLSVLLRNPLLAAIVAFFSSTLFAIVFALVGMVNVPKFAEVKAIPAYLWFAGGLFSVVGLSLYYYTIPKLGVSTIISLGLSGQLIFATVAGHFGWFGLPTEPITVVRLIGILMMITSILLINWK